MSYYDPYPHRPQRPSPITYVWPFVLVLGVVLLLAYWFWPRRGAELDPTATPRPVDPAGPLYPGEEAVIKLYEKSAPSVVNVTGVALRRDAFSLNILRIPRGTGSGFVWDKEGRIVTNYHVIEKASEVHVTLSDHSSWPVKMVRADPDMDLAVLWIDAPKDRLRPIPLGKSSDLKVGQYAYAIGNPFGLDQSLAPGFVSALNREIESATGRPIKGVIQTTAPINPGNSGGPLLDSHGRLIGVNTAILSPSGAFAGIGFAIPVDDVNRVVPQLISKGRVIRAGLGIQEASDQLARRLGADGVMILNIYAQGPAHRAGLQPTRRQGLDLIPGDAIVAVEGKPVRRRNDLYALLERYSPGDEVTMTVQRGSDGKTFEVRVTLEERK